MKILKQESGQVLVLSALSMMLLMGFMGLAADVGTLFHAKRQLQAAADAAAIAGITAYKYETTSGNTQADIDNAAKAAAAKNGFSNVTVTNAFPTSVTSPTLYIANPPTDGPNRSADFVEARITVPQSTFFMAMFGTTSMNVTARAVAGFGGATTNCDTNLGKLGTDLYIAGRATVLAPDCSIVNDSSDPCSMQFNGTSAKLITSSVSTVGDACGQSSDSTPAPVTHSGYVDDPLLGIVNPISLNDSSFSSICSSGNTVTSATISSSTASSYAPPTSGSIVCFAAKDSKGNPIPTTISGPSLSNCPGGPTLTNSLQLGSAIYVFENGLIFGGGCIMTGTGGVTFDLAGSYKQGNTYYSYSVSTQTYFQLDPMKTSVACTTCSNGGAGDYGNSGVLIMQPYDNSAQINIDQGTSVGTIDGTIYAPSAELSLTDQGAQSLTGVSLTLNATLVDNDLSVQASNVTINAQDPGTLPGALRKVTLVE